MIFVIYMFFYFSLVNIFGDLEVLLVFSKNELLALFFFFYYRFIFYFIDFFSYLYYFLSSTFFGFNLLFFPYSGPLHISKIFIYPYILK